MYRPYAFYICLLLNQKSSTHPPMSPFHLRFVANLFLTTLAGTALPSINDEQDSPESLQHRCEGLVGILLNNNRSGASGKGGGKRDAIPTPFRKTNIQVGTTKVFLRQADYDLLEKIIRVIFRSASNKITSFCQDFLKEYLSMISEKYFCCLFIQVIHEHTCTHTCTHAHMHTHTHTHMHTCTHAHMHTHTHAHTCTCTHTHIHIYTHTHAHIHTCLYLVPYVSHTIPRMLFFRPGGHQRVFCL